METKKIVSIAEFLKRLPGDFTGRIELNFFKGGITNINKLESFKLGEKREIKA